MVIGSAMTVKKTQVPTPTNAHFPTTIVHCHEMPMVKTSHMPRSARRRLTLACLVILVQSVLSCTPPERAPRTHPPSEFVPCCTGSIDRCRPECGVTDLLPTAGHAAHTVRGTHLRCLGAADSEHSCYPSRQSRTYPTAARLPRPETARPNSESRLVHLRPPCPGKTRQHAESGVWRSRTDTRDRIRRNTGSCPQTSIQSPALVDEWDLLPVVAAIGGADQRCRLEWHPCDSF